MRFLIDAQLPPILARQIRELGHQAEHVADLRLAAAKDSVIWEEAITRGAVLISKDADFVAMRALQANGPTVYLGSHWQYDTARIVQTHRGCLA